LAYFAIAFDNFLSTKTSKTMGFFDEELFHQESFLKILYRSGKILFSGSFHKDQELYIKEEEVRRNFQKMLFEW